METDNTLKDFLLNTVSRKDSIMRYEIDNVIAKPIISLHLILLDIEEMIGCMDNIILLGKVKNANNLIVSALWEKAIISYGKIFSKSNDGFSSIESSTYFKNDGDIMRHNMIIDTRNNYIAHRGYNDFEYNIMVLDVVGTEEECYMEFSVPSLRKVGDYFNPNTVRKHFRNLSKKVKRQLALKRNKLELRFFQEIGLDPKLD